MRGSPGGWTRALTHTAKEIETNREGVEIEAWLNTDAPWTACDAGRRSHPADEARANGVAMRDDAGCQADLGFGATRETIDR